MLTNVRLAKIDISQNPMLKEMYNITQVPTLKGMKRAWGEKTPEKAVAWKDLTHDGIVELGGYLKDMSGIVPKPHYLIS